MAGPLRDLRASVLGRGDLMAGGYGSHRDYVGSVLADADSRQAAVEGALRKAFLQFIERREVEVILFAGMDALDLAKAITTQPIILKPLLAACNIAARAIERDLNIKNLDTFDPRLTADQAKVIAGYIKPFLPPYLELPALSQIDRISFIDKEIRKLKGRWEQLVLQSLNAYGVTRFRKRNFLVGGEEFQLDAATPEEGDILLGIDVKRIEARKDIHKRCDEIVNKASKLKSVYRKARFAAVIYYPFVDEHVNIQNRLRSSVIDGVFFASGSLESVQNAVRLLLSSLDRSTR